MERFSCCSKNSQNCCNSLVRAIILFISFCTTFALWFGVSCLFYYEKVVFGLLCCLVMITVPVLVFYVWEIKEQSSHPLNNVCCDLIFGMLYYSLFNGVLVCTSFGINWLYAIDFWGLGLFCCITFSITMIWGAFVPCMKRRAPGPKKGADDRWEYPVFTVPLHNNTQSIAVWIDQSITDIYNRRFHASELEDLPPSYEECCVTANEN